MANPRGRRRAPAQRDKRGAPAPPSNTRIARRARMLPITRAWPRAAPRDRYISEPIIYIIHIYICVCAVSRCQGPRRVWGMPPVCGLGMSAIGMPIPAPCARRYEVGQGTDHDLQAAIRPTAAQLGLRCPAIRPMCPFVGAAHEQKAPHTQRHKPVCIPFIVQDKPQI